MTEQPITGEIIIPLAGLQYYRLGAVRDCIMQGTRLRLVRQRDNPYDANAILVELHARDLVAEEIPLPDGMRETDIFPLGHIPATTTSENWARLLSSGLDDGLDAECFYFEGDKVGSWSVWARLTGPAVEHAQKALAARATAFQEARRAREARMREYWNTPEGQGDDPFL